MFQWQIFNVASEIYSTSVHPWKAFSSVAKVTRGLSSWGEVPSAMVSSFSHWLESIPKFPWWIITHSAHVIIGPVTVIVLGDQLKAFKCGWHLVCRWLTPLQLGGREAVGRADPHIAAAAGPPSRHTQLLDLRAPHLEHLRCCCTCLRMIQTVKPPYLTAKVWFPSNI